jgi:hypothetical protein
VRALFASRFSSSDYRVVAVYWVLATLVIFPSYVMEFDWWRGLLGMAYTIALDTAAVYALVFVILPRLAGGRGLLRPLLTLLGFVAVSGLLYHFGYHLILYPFKPLNLARFTNAVIGHAQSYGVLGVLMMGKSYFDAQQRLLRAQKAQAESELKSLRAQIDPHFLFNNLNILYALIQQDRQEASHFLSCFSSLYRYLIRHKDADLVPLEEELRFADEYIYLLQHRFGSAYEFRKTVHVPEPMLAGMVLVPGTLQVLIENVIKHNRGGDDTPLLVTIHVYADALVVRNPVALKRTGVDSMGTGLPNLRERYRLLTEQELRVEYNDFFTVTAPLLLLHRTPRPVPLTSAASVL